ncbi:MAG: hypothetical protein KMY55_01455 [Dethiosulfatibacter sp.]|nr:hypothetical protein [Dethiosulfatibacter sp.]
MTSLHYQINDLYKLHLAATELKHGVLKQDWTFFEPSRFVYAYFGFNSFYSINWEASTIKNELIKWDHKNNQSEEDDKLTEPQKIRRMIKFIYNTCTQTNVSHTDQAEKNKEFAKQFERIMKNRYRMDFQVALTQLSRMNTPEKTKVQFIHNFEMILSTELTGKRFKDTWEDILYFIYNIRNNIFHGSKTIVDMMDKSQQRRLRIYTALLLVTNEMLFEAIDKTGVWSKNEEDKLLSRHKQDQRNNRSIGLYEETIAERFNLSIPNGPLFYPCVGNDTIKPIKRFMDTITEFHFVDLIQLPNLPKLKLEIIKKAKAYESYSTSVNEMILNQWETWGIESAGYRGQPGITHKDEWIHADSNRTIEIYRHIQDGLAAFSNIEKLAVFYLCGDSEGEGGSGQRWFQESILKLMLDKLLDGGLIVTDGSSWDPQIYRTAEWKGLWQYRLDRGISKPIDFKYYNRMFKCIGECGRKYGPIYVWQVNRV